MQFAFGRANKSRTRQLLDEWGDLVVADSRNIAGFDVGTFPRISTRPRYVSKSPVSSLLCMQEIVETGNDLAGLVVDGEQEFLLLFAVWK